MKPEFTLGLVATTLFSANGILYKLISKHQIGDRWAFLFYYYLTYVPLVFLFLFVAEIDWPRDFLWLALLYSSLFFIANIFFFTAIYEMDISAYTPLFEIQTFFIALLAYPILGERFAPILYLWFGLAILGAVFASYEEEINLRNALRKPPFWYMVIAQVFFALSNIVSGLALRWTDAPNLIFWTSIFSGLLILPSFLFKSDEIRAGIKGAPTMFASSVVVFPAVLALFRAFEINVTVPAVLLAAGTPLTFLVTVSLSKIKPELLEKHSAKVYFVKGVGTALTFGAVLLMIFSS